MPATIATMVPAGMLPPPGESLGIFSKKMADIVSCGVVLHEKNKKCRNTNGRRGCFKYCHRGKKYEKNSVMKLPLLRLFHGNLDGKICTKPVSLRPKHVQ